MDRLFHGHLGWSLKSILKATSNVLIIMIICFQLFLVMLCVSDLCSHLLAIFKTATLPFSHAFFPTFDQDIWFFFFFLQNVLRWVFFVFLLFSRRSTSSYQNSSKDNREATTLRSGELNQRRCLETTSHLLWYLLRRNHLYAINRSM